MRRIRFLAVLLLCAAFTAAPLRGKAFSDFEIAPALNYTFSSGEWQISFPSGFTSQGELIKTVSRLHFGGMQNASPALLARCRLYDILALRLLLQPSFLEVYRKHGDTTDQDLDSVAGNEFLFSESVSEGTDRSSVYGIDALLRIKRFCTRRSLPLDLNLLVGYTKSIEDINMRNGVQTVSNDPGIPPAGSRFPGLDSTYKFKWDSIAAGLNFASGEQAKFSFDTTLALLMNFYSAEGFWNLRTFNAGPDPFAWRNESPNYEHSDAVGTGYHFSLGAAVRLSPASRLSLTYTRRYMHAEDGKVRIFFFDPSLDASSNDITLDYASFTKDIITLAYTVRF